METGNLEESDEMLATQPDVFRNMKPGPVVVVHAWTTAYVKEIVSHHQALGFENILLCVPQSEDLTVEGAITVKCSEGAKNPDNAHTLLNEVIPHLDGRWVLFVGASDFLYFPFCNSRNIKDLLVFMEDERRSSLHGLVVDLFPSRTPPKGSYPKRDSANLDKEGYFRERVSQSPEMSERLLKIFGGLRARLSDFLPENLHHANQVTFFKAHKDLRVHAGMRFDDPEFNTIGCPWHHNASVAVVSFDIYMRLKMLDEGPAAASFTWDGSQKFEGTDTQLMELGFMEPGQWF